MNLLPTEHPGSPLPPPRHCHPRPRPSLATAAILRWAVRCRGGWSPTKASAIDRPSALAL
eukprot:scaffold16635_cov137-Isochrysis_galbana.AAC.2